MRRLGEFVNDQASLVRKELRAFAGLFNAAMPVEDLQNFRKGNLIVVAIGKNSLDAFALFRVGGLQGIDERQGYLSFAQVVADGLTENLLPRRKVENIVDQLERDPQVPGIFAEFRLG